MGSRTTVASRPHRISREMLGTIGLLLCLAGCGVQSRRAGGDTTWARASVELVGGLTEQDLPNGTEDAGFVSTRTAILVEPFSWFAVGGRAGANFATQGDTETEQPNDIKLRRTDLFGEGVVRFTAPLDSPVRPYVEGFCGGLWRNIDLEVESSNTPRGERGTTGIGYGGQIGFDWDTNDDSIFTLGLEYRRTEVDSDAIGGIDADDWGLVLGLSFRF